MSLINVFNKAIIACTPRNFYLKSKLANGAYVLGKNMPGFGGRGVFIDGDQIEPELWALENFIDKGDVFIDIGANTGVYTMKAAKSLDGTGTVIACEPFVGVFESLIRSVEYNKF